MYLYHISENNYKIGTIISSDNFEETYYYTKVKGENQHWRDDFLDSIRPSGYPARKKAIFAFDSLANCYAYSNSRGIVAHYFRVELDNPIKCPMHLVDKLKKKNPSYNKRLSKEYWNPQSVWKYLEYLSAKMKIIEKIEESYIDKKQGYNNITLDDMEWESKFKKYL